MSSISLVDSLATLEKRVDDWIAFLPADRHLAEMGCSLGEDRRVNWSEYSFIEGVSAPLKQLVLGLGAAGLVTHAQEIKDDVQRLRAAATEVVSACNALGSSPTAEFWQDLDLHDLRRHINETSFLIQELATLKETLAYTREAVPSHESLREAQANDPENLPTVIIAGLASAEVELDGVRYQVDPLGAKAIQCLVEAFPHEVALGGKLETKPSRVISKLPLGLRTHCKSMGNKGYRWTV